MPVAHTFDGSLLRLRLVDECAPEEVTGAFLDALGDPDCPGVVALLVDITASTLETHDAFEIRYVAQFLGPYSERIGGRCAVLVGTDLDYAITRMGAVFAMGVGVKTKIFRHEESALYWLGKS